jgi:hypothetical protein
MERFAWRQLGPDYPFCFNQSIFQILPTFQLDNHERSPSVASEISKPGMVADYFG